jgi:diacylglycerol kinase
MLPFVSIFALLMNRNNQEKKNSVHYQLNTFRYAFNGLKLFFSGELKAWIHLFLAIMAIAAGIILHIGMSGWIAVSFAIGFVFLAEILNTVIEGIVDHISPEKSEMARSAKDLSAAAVLVAAITALTIGLLVFVPKIIHLIHFV